MRIRLTPQNGFAGLIDPATVKTHARIEYVIPYLLRDRAYARYGTRNLYQYGNARELVGHCPFHDDAHPSLLVNPTKQLWFCPPCAIGGDVIDFTRRYNETQHYPMTFAQIIGWLHEHRAQWQESEGNRPLQLSAHERCGRTVYGRGKNDIDASAGAYGASEWIIYPYVNAHGRELYQVVRTPDKAFLFRHAKLGGGWIWNGTDVRRVVYMLHALQGCRRVYIAEGEKDADTLWSHRLPATTNCGGAGKWRDEYSTQLVNAGVRRVVILPDNDAAGRAHAKAVARSCRAADLRVTVLSLPGLPDKGDVTDWFDLGHKRRDLRRVVNAIINREAR